MSYSEIIKPTSKKYKEKTQVVFSDIIGETKEQGSLADFIRETENNLNASIDNPTSNDAKYKKEIITLLSELKKQSEKNNKWLTLMGLIERKIIQFRLLRNKQISYSTQLQKSGDNKFNYILLRAPFMELYSGKKEVRVYYNKLEDYKGFNSIDQLKLDDNFKTKSTDSIGFEMEKIIDKEGITTEFLINEIRKYNEINNQNKEDIMKLRDENAYLHNKINELELLNKNK